MVLKITKIFIIIILILLPIITIGEEKQNFKLTLEYYSRPVINKEWKISIYRTNNKLYVKSENFQHKNFTKRILYNQYTILIKKLNKLGIRTAKGCYSKHSKNEFYQFTINTKNLNNNFKAPANIPLYGKNSVYTQMIRLIKNFTQDIGNDL